MQDSTNGQSVFGDATADEIVVRVGEMLLSAREGLARELIDELIRRGIDPVPGSLLRDVERARAEVHQADEALAAAGGCSTATTVRHALWAVEDVLRRVSRTLAQPHGGALAAPLIGLFGGLGLAIGSLLGSVPFG